MGKEKMGPHMVWFPPTLWEKIRKAAARDDISMSELIRRAVVIMLAAR